MSETNFGTKYLTVGCRLFFTRDLLAERPAEERLYYSVTGTRGCGLTDEGCILHTLWKNFADMVLQSVHICFGISFLSDGSENQKAKEENENFV